MRPSHVARGTRSYGRQLLLAAVVAAVVVGVVLVAARLMHQEPPVVVSTSSTTGRPGSTLGEQEVPGVVSTGSTTDQAGSTTGEAGSTTDQAGSTTDEAGPTLGEQEAPGVVSTSSPTGKAGSTTDGAGSTTDRAGSTTDEVVSTSSTTERAGMRWQHVLERLDVSRSRAWRQGRPDLLRDVYTRRSAELQRDRAMLRKYTHRNLEARGVRLAFGRVRVAGRADGVVRLDVVDQLRAVVVVDRDGRSAALPRDLPTRHSIILQRTAAGWRIASVQRR